MCLCIFTIKQHTCTKNNLDLKLDRQKSKRFACKKPTRICCKAKNRALIFGRRAPCHDTGLRRYNNSKSTSASGFGGSGTSLGLGPVTVPSRVWDRSRQPLAPSVSELIMTNCDFVSGRGRRDYYIRWSARQRGPRSGIVSGVRRFGGIRLICPSGVRIECRGWLLLGSLNLFTNLRLDGE